MIEAEVASPALDPRTTVVVANPVARHGRLGRALSTLRPQLEQIGRLELTSGPGDARRIARDAALSGASAVVSIGGDGTHSQVVDGLMSHDGHRPALGLLDFGTGGDFARLLPKRSLSDAIEALDGATVTPLDCGWVIRGGARRAFLNIASFGIGGLVDRWAERLKRLGPLAFPAATIAALGEWRTARVGLRLDGVELGEHDITNVLCANGRYGAGGVCFAPEARPDDGVFDVVVLPAVSARQLPGALVDLYAGRIATSPGVRLWKGQVLEAWAVAGRALLDIDGEPGPEIPVRIEIAPGALRLLGALAF